MRRLVPVLGVLLLSSWILCHGAGETITIPYTFAGDTYDLIVHLRSPEDPIGTRIDMQSGSPSVEINGEDAHYVRHGYRFPGGCFEMHPWNMAEADFVSYFLEHHRFELLIDGEAIAPSSVSVYPEDPELTASYGGIYLWVRWKVLWTFEFAPGDLLPGKHEFTGTYICIPPENELQGAGCYTCYPDAFPSIITTEVTVLSSAGQAGPSEPPTTEVNALQYTAAAPLTEQPMIGTGEITRTTFDFDGSLGEGWEWRNGDPEGWSLEESPGELRIDVQGGRVWEDTTINTLMRAVGAEEFTIETKVRCAPTEDHQQAGLAIFDGNPGRGACIMVSRAFCGDSGAECVGLTLYLPERHYGTSRETCEVSRTDSSQEDGLYLRLVKRGAEVEAQYSEDGETWLVLGSEEFDYCQGSVMMGLVASSGNTGAAVIPAHFDYVSVETSGSLGVSRAQIQDALVEGWELRDVSCAGLGLGETPGSVCIDVQEGQFSQSTAKNVVMRSVQGDFTIETRVHCTPTEDFQQAGLFLGSGGYPPGDDCVLLTRAFRGSLGNGIYFDSTETSNSFRAEPDVKDVAYLRLTKRGTNAKAQYSVDGETWVILGVHEFDFAASLKVGLIATSGNTGATVIPACFDYVTFEPTS